ncbi:MAG: threonine/homoserine/homoserine lactone efflux protein [Saprospiraceae bacterium]|jgi:threonine/homoserine/homoserine lactone efflux protein
MMQLILEGSLLGLGLCFLLGPIFIILIQASIERGARAGLIAASGIWVSDILIVYLILNFIKNISPFVENKGFVFWMGLIGGAVLIGVGMATFVKESTISFDQKGIGAKGYFHLWFRGFMVNTVNPFTIIFWLSIATTRVSTRYLNSKESFIFMASIIAVIVLTDSIKVFMAKWIRTRITAEILMWINKIAGISLIFFGLFMLVKSVW